MRQDHPIGIDSFVSQTCQLSPHVNPIQALQLLQECIKIMLQTSVTAPLGVLADSCSQSLITSSSRPGPTPSIFCPSIDSSIKLRLLILVLLNPFRTPNRSGKPRSSHF